jgi:hypothetical protein
LQTDETDQQHANDGTDSQQDKLCFDFHDVTPYVCSGYKPPDISRWYRLRKDNILIQWRLAMTAACPGHSRQKLAAAFPSPLAGERGMGFANSTGFLTITKNVGRIHSIQQLNSVISSHG